MSAGSVLRLFHPSYTPGGSFDHESDWCAGECGGPSVFFRQARTRDPFRCRRCGWFWRPRPLPQPLDALEPERFDPGDLK